MSLTEKILREASGDKFAEYGDMRSVLEQMLPILREHYQEPFYVRLDEAEGMTSEFAQPPQIEIGMYPDNPDKDEDDGERDKVVKVTLWFENDELYAQQNVNSDSSDTDYEFRAFAPSEIRYLMAWMDDFFNSQV